MATYILIIFWYGDIAATNSFIPNLTQKECETLKAQIYPPAGKMSIQCVNKASK